MVANLEGILIGVAGVQKNAITAIIPLTVADLRHTNTLPVVVAEILGFVQIQLCSEGKQCISGLPVFLAEIKLSQSPFQTFITDIVRFPLANDSLNGFCNHSVSYQNGGQKGQIFISNSLLECNAGSGNQSRPGRFSFYKPGLLKDNSSSKICVGFADSGSGVAEGNSTIQHHVKHSMTQLGLFRTFRQTLGGKKFLENMIYVLMSVPPDFFLHLFVPLFSFL